MNVYNQIMSTTRTLMLTHYRTRQERQYCGNSVFLGAAILAAIQMLRGQGNRFYKEMG